MIEGYSTPQQTFTPFKEGNVKFANKKGSEWVKQEIEEPEFYIDSNDFMEFFKSFTNYIRDDGVITEGFIPLNETLNRVKSYFKMAPLVNNVSTVGEETLNLLKEQYTLQNSDKIVEFLNKNSDVLTLLNRSYNHIRNHFKSEELILEVVKDPELFTENLFIYISTPYVPKETINKRRLLDKEWGLYVFNITGGKLCLHIAPQ